MDRFARVSIYLHVCKFAFLSKICMYANQDLHFVELKCKSKSIAYGVKLTQVSKSVHMGQFAYVSKIAYKQINTQVSKTVHVYGA